MRKRQDYETDQFWSVLKLEKKQVMGDSQELNICRRSLHKGPLGSKDLQCKWAPGHDQSYPTRTKYAKGREINNFRLPTPWWTEYCACHTEQPPTSLLFPTCVCHQKKSTKSCATPNKILTLPKYGISGACPTKHTRLQSFSANDSQMVHAFCTSLRGHKKDQNLSKSQSLRV